MTDETGAGIRMRKSTESSSSDGFHPIGSTGKRPPIPSFRMMPDSSLEGESKHRASQNAVASTPLTQNVEMDNTYEINSATELRNNGDDEMERSFSSNEGLLSSDGSMPSDDGDDEDSSDEDDAVAPMSLQERMIRNQLRNTQFLESLHAKYEQSVPMSLSNKLAATKRRKRHKSTMTSDDNGDKNDQTYSFQGMLRPRVRPLAEDVASTDTTGYPVSFSHHLKALMKEYPYREGQIRRLTALLHGSIGTGHLSNPTISSDTQSAIKVQPSVHIPGPIFLTGPRAVGKTSIVKDVLRLLQATERQSDGRSRFSSAYVNCATLDPPSIERLVADAYRQLKPTTPSILRRERLKRRHATSKKEPFSPNARNSPKSVRDGLTPSAAEIREGQPATQPAQVNDTLLDDSQPRLQPRRAAKNTAPPLTTTTTGKSKRTTHKAQNGTNMIDEKAEGMVETSHSAVVAFGRSLQRYFGRGTNRAAVLVLDHGERLLTLSARKSGEKTNSLAELLLLPKLMHLNMTIVVISRFSLLYGTRLDNMASPEKSAANLEGSLGGMTIQFPAYTEQKAIGKILKTSKLLPRIIGKVHAKSSTGLFMSKVIDGFFSALIQLLSDSTIDLNEYIRIGRSLWPVYIKPLNPDAIEATLANANGKDEIVGTDQMDREIIGLMGRHFLSEIGSVSMDLRLLQLDSSVKESSSLPVKPFQVSNLQLPFLRTCLLLAAFICQTNHAENDKKVFSVHGNGKRRKIRKAEDGNEEAVAFASSALGVEHLRSLRPRPFLVERVFSVYVTVVRLNPDCAPKLPGKKRIEYTAESLGTSRIYDDLWSLIDLGFIHPVAFSSGVRGELINFNGAKCWCSLTENEARELATSVDIPLESYLV